MGIRSEEPLTGIGLTKFTSDLINDLNDLREGKLSVKDARARAMLAREILRSVHLQLEGAKFMSINAKPVKQLGGSDVSPESES
jgi:hypothetical protein